MVVKRNSGVSTGVGLGDVRVMTDERRRRCHMMMRDDGGATMYVCDIGARYMEANGSCSAAAAGGRGGANGFAFCGDACTGCVLGSGLIWISSFAQSIVLASRLCVCANGVQIEGGVVYCKHRETEGRRGTKTRDGTARRSARPNESMKEARVHVQLDRKLCSFYCCFRVHDPQMAKPAYQ